MTLPEVDRPPFLHLPQGCNSTLQILHPNPARTFTGFAVRPCPPSRPLSVRNPGREPRLARADNLSSRASACSARCAWRPHARTRCPCVPRPAPWLRAPFLFFVALPHLVHVLSRARAGETWDESIGRYALGLLAHPYSCFRRALLRTLPSCAAQALETLPSLNSMC